MNSFLFFSGIFILLLSFTIVDCICSFHQFQGFSSLFLQVFLFHHCLLLLFFGCFHFPTLRRFFTLHSFSTFATVPQGLRILEKFFALRRFLLYTLFRHLAQPAFIRQDFQLRFETQTRTICSIESHSVQQNVSVVRFY